MEPTLHEGDRLLVLYGARPRRGTLAVVALPDDTSGVARPLAVKRLAYPDPDGSDGSDGWWVERDNPAEGLDSWAIGAIAADDIRARVLLRLPTRRLPRRLPRQRFPITRRGN
ncbi:MAG: peptidase S24 [Phycicoccus sp.]|nr:peptidase S24 [Phycicoccus sp.]NMM35427.1 peptidase S24 [Phycicoccus sp.]